MTQLTQKDLEERNQQLEERTPQELIRWAKDVFGSRLAAISAMQSAGSIVCCMMGQMKLNIPVLFVDTGVLFQETLDTRDRIQKEYGLEIVTLSPKQTMAEQIQEKGVLYLSPEGQEVCCDLRKTEPLHAVADQYDGIISSLRRGDGGKRAKMPILSVDPKMNCIRINPLATFSNEQMEEFSANNNVITNPLHDQGYPTIGCNRCTTPVLPDEPKRAGRWRHLGPWSMYCGINATDVEGGTEGKVDLSLDLIDRILGRETDYVI
ncbi:Phosphoadenosine phosphosulfate reductase [Polystyrenella longa]|uniref:Adenosine 5'-phosphosulfate reductase n=1 Tax=Polystyrenella longa TaxID=2528007 RepID=A0A518CQH4_9PLAN|nr:phosphoadenylyl-sulfate reductase [Polystyrenella longa]QDU81471.1 Phosphoadenosine phosphosulfate reductase [Polystyrenella longa]